MKVVWSSRARNSVERYAAYIAADNAEAAERWVVGVFDAVRNLGAFPESGRVVPEVREPLIREVLYVSHRIIYRIRRNIQIVSVRHQRQQIDLRELGLE